jgi:hypothetical protein
VWATTATSGQRCTIFLVAATRPRRACGSQQHHVRDQLLDQGDGGLAGVGLADDLPAADLLEQRARHPPDRRVVVDEQDPPGAAGPRDGRLHGLPIGCAGSRMNSETIGF